MARTRAAAARCAARRLRRLSHSLPHIRSKLIAPSRSALLTPPLRARLPTFAGEIPERTIFFQAGLEAALAPYFELAQAVRRGDLRAFHETTEKHAAVFAADKTANLIVRLRRNVIRTGLRRLSLAYSCISLADVAAKLGLASPEDAECIVSKAIRDGSIEAVLDHASGWMQSHEVADVYSSTVPQGEFHSRITFCLDLHNEAVKAMRFPGDGTKKSLETPEARRERCAGFEI